MAERLEIRQINRKRKRLKEQRKKRFRLAVAGFIFLFSFIFVIKPQIRKNNKASADSPSLISTDYIKNTDESKADKNKDSVVRAKDDLLAMDKGFTDYMRSYKVVNKDTEVYKERYIDSKPALKLQKGEYVKFYGSEKGWAKVGHKNIFGYVKAINLEPVEQGFLTVRKGLLYLDTKNKLPDDFEADFDIEAESSLLVAMEAMRREGLEVDVTRKLSKSGDLSQLEKKSDSKDKDNLAETYADELRSGLSVEIRPAKTNLISKSNFFDTKEGQWVKMNMHRYGFILRYPEDKEAVTGLPGNQHLFRYVGADNSESMYNNNLTMEEYFKK